jgi:hypothetical protein
MTTTTIRRWALAGFVALAGATGVGGLASVAQAGMGTPTSHIAKKSHNPKKHTKHRSRPKMHRSASGIPQHNGGDHDADNNGGPSDGDGNV